MFILPAGSFAFEVSLRKSVRISLIAVSGSVHKDRLKQCHVRRPLLVYGRYPIVLASRLPMWAPSSCNTGHRC